MRSSKRAIVVLMTVLVGLLAAPVLGASSNATPEDQIHNYGVSSRWTLYWGGEAPFNISFFYGDGTQRNFVNRYDTSEPASHTYYPCRETQYRQSLLVYERDNASAIDFTFARERGGDLC